LFIGAQARQRGHIYVLNAGLSYQMSKRRLRFSIDGSYSKRTTDSRGCSSYDQKRFSLTTSTVSLSSGRSALMQTKLHKFPPPRSRGVGRDSGELRRFRRGACRLPRPAPMQMPPYSPWRRAWRPPSSPQTAGHADPVLDSRSPRRGTASARTTSIEVDVLGQSDFKTRARVRSDGTVTLPYLGVVPVAGETAITLADKLGAQLKAGGYYAKPVVSVEIVGFVSNYVIVLGEIGSAGMQPVDRGYRLSEIIARAGGLRATAAEEVTLTHPDGVTKKYVFEKLATGGPDDDPVVKAGDKVFVPAAEQFYIYGQINQPGVYAIRSDMTLRRALGRAAASRRRDRSRRSRSIATAKSAR
jgi:polysaccharide export outer membrane protein